MLLSFIWWFPHQKKKRRRFVASWWQRFAGGIVDLLLEVAQFWGTMVTLLQIWMFYPLVMTNIAIENDHRNSGFSHQKWWFSIVMLNYQRVIKSRYLFLLLSSAFTPAYCSYPHCYHYAYQAYNVLSCIANYCYHDYDGDYYCICTYGGLLKN